MLAEFRDGEYRWKSSEKDRDYFGSFQIKRLPKNNHVDRPVAELWSFGIYGQHRGKGYGQEMLREAIELAGNKPMVLYVEKGNERALHIYKKAGFEIIGEHNGYAWVMLKSATK